MNPASEVTVSVFVPGLMGAGILLSGGILLADGIKRFVPNRGLRRRLAVARAVNGVVKGAARAAGYRVPEYELFPRRLRTRWAYVAMAVALAIAGLLATRMFMGAYADPRGTLHENPWAIALAMVADVPLLLGALACGSVALLYRHPPEPALRLVASTWLGRPTTPSDEPAERANPGPVVERRLVVNALDTPSPKGLRSPAARLRRRVAIAALVGFLAYTGAYIFIYLWRAFRLDESEAARTAGIWHGDPFARAILVSVLFAIGLIVLLFAASTHQRVARSGLVRLRPDLWEWLEREAAETNESPSRLAERAIAFHRARLEGTREI